jgi:LysR family transcriptional regulator, transcriptional activator of nhaA
MILLNYNHLHYFHVVATEGSIANAALRLGVTQPTVSEQIRALERHLGVTLFDRVNNGLRLTQAGRAAYEQTSVMFRAGERLLDTIKIGERGVPKSLRVGISTSVSRSAASHFLTPLLSLDNCMPAIHTDDGNQLLRDARGGELDLILMESEPSKSLRRGLDLALIHKTRLVAVARPNVTPSATWAELSLIQYRASASFRWDVESFLQARGLKPRIAAEADDPMFLVEAAARSNCVAIVPRSAARDALEAGRLIVIAEVEPSQAAVYALFQDGETAELARRAVETLIAHAQATES